MTTTTTTRSRIRQRRKAIREYLKATILISVIIYSWHLATITGMFR